LVVEPGAAPDVAVGVGVDDVLQRRAEIAQGAHARLDRLVAEDPLAQLEALLVKLPRIHGFLRMVHDIESCKKSWHCPLRWEWVARPSRKATRAIRSGSWSPSRRAACPTRSRARSGRAGCPAGRGPRT